MPRRRRHQQNAFIAIKLEQHDYYFAPTILNWFGTAEDLTIQVRNVSDHEHTFAIDEFGVDVTIQPGDTQNVTVKNKTGNYVFYCRFHRDRGMEGTLPLKHESPTRP